MNTRHSATHLILIPKKKRSSSQEDPTYTTDLRGIEEDLRCKEAAGFRENRKKAVMAQSVVVEGHANGLHQKSLTAMIERSST
jgi:hypothetical protein